MATEATHDDGRAMRSITIALCLAVAVLLWPLWPPLILAAWIAQLGRPLLGRVARALHGRHRAASVLTVLLVLALLVPLTLIGAGLVSATRDLIVTLSQSRSARSALMALTRRDGGSIWPRDPGQLLPLLERVGASSYGVVTGLAGAAAKVLIGVLVFVGGVYVLLVEGPSAWRWLREHSPLPAKDADRLAAAFHETGRGLLVGVGLTTVTQSLVATLAYLALGVPRAWLLGPITGLAAVIPVVGTALIWAPVAAGLYLDGSKVKALILVLLGLAVIGSVDNLLRPVFTRYGKLEMPLYLVFISAFGGLALVGPWGALLGPLVARLALEALSLRTA